MGMRFLIIALSLLISSISYAQGSSSEQLERAMSRQMDAKLGTLSGQKSDRKGKALEHAYTHFNKAPAAAKVAKKDFSQSYSEFRKKHNIPDYVGDTAIDTALTKDDDEQKKEAVKIVETEKLLHQIYEVYHEDTSADKDLKDKADVIAKQSAGILRGSMQKLSFKPNRSASSKKTVFLASGGRYFSSAAKQDNILAVKSHVVDQIRKDIVKAMSAAINSYFRGHQKSTALTKAQDAKQLVAFVRGAQKSMSRMTSKEKAVQVRKMRAFIQQWVNRVNQGKNSAVKLTAEDIERLDKLVLGLSAQQTSQLNQRYISQDADHTTANVFRPDVDPNKLSPAAQKEFYRSMNNFFGETDKYNAQSKLNTNDTGTNSSIFSKSRLSGDENDPSTSEQNNSLMNRSISQSRQLSPRETERFNQSAAARAGRTTADLDKLSPAEVDRYYRDAERFEKERNP